MNTLDRTHEARRIVSALGGTTAVAKIFGIRPPSVSEWLSNGIPDARMMYIKLAYPKLFKGSKAKAVS